MYIVHRPISAFFCDGTRQYGVMPIWHVFFHGARISYENQLKACCLSASIRHVYTGTFLFQNSTGVDMVCIII